MDKQFMKYSKSWNEFTGTEIDDFNRYILKVFNDNLY